MLLIGAYAVLGGMIAFGWSKIKELWLMRKRNTVTYRASADTVRLLRDHPEAAMLFSKHPPFAGAVSLSWNDETDGSRSVSMMLKKEDELLRMREEGYADLAVIRDPSKPHIPPAPPDEQRANVSLPQPPKQTADGETVILKSYLRGRIIKDWLCILLIALPALILFGLLTYALIFKALLPRL